MDRSDNGPDKPMSAVEIRGWLEFVAWCSFAMTPAFWWMQGPSVSTDQFYVRSGLLVVSFLAGVGMRIWTIMEKRHHDQET